MIGSVWEIYHASPLFPFVFPKGHHARRLVSGSAALAFRRHVALRREWSRICNVGPGDRSLSAKTAADPASRFHSRSTRGALRPGHIRGSLGVQRRAEGAYISVILAGTSSLP